MLLWNPIMGGKNMSRGKKVKELNRMVIRTKNDVFFDIYSPCDKKLLAKNLSRDDAENFCLNHTEYIAYPVSEQSRKYLSQYLLLTDKILLAIGKHAMRYALHSDICAYYYNLEDFFSDWTGIGYTRTEARAMLHGKKGEFFKLPDNLGYVRFAI